LAILPNDHPRIVARPYQVEANTAIEKAIEARKRQMLLAMATGTGKTFMTVNEVYRLMKAGVAKRILFLVDRRALAAQAVRTFASFEPETGHKFNQLYHVYSQRFHRDDFGEEEKFDPTVSVGNLRSVSLGCHSAKPGENRTPVGHDTRLKSSNGGKPACYLVALTGIEPVFED
jgi:superfamily II DNA or RNA helicase